MTIGAAWTTYRRVSAGFPEPELIGASWRADLALGSGLTALAVEAALRDVASHRGTWPGRVVTDPALLSRMTINSAEGRMLGCSFSGGASEVLDGIAWLRHRGLACDLLSNRIGADLHIPDGLAERPFQSLAFSALVPILLRTPVPARSVEIPPVAPFLQEAARLGLVPLFVADETDFHARTLLAFWLEYVRRPGFLLRFPDFTHNFMWASVRSPSLGFAFVLQRPITELSDRRFEKLHNLLCETGFPTYVFQPPNAPQGGDHVGWLLGVADALYGLALLLGCNMAAELTFEHWRGAASCKSNG
jgi:hypothetical protein